LGIISLAVSLLLLVNILKRGTMKESIKKFAELLQDKIKDKRVYLVSHYDTDGITSAAIFSKMFGRMGVQFSVNIVKQFGVNEIATLPEDRVIVLLDLGSGSSLEELNKFNGEVFVIDHHEITGKVGKVNFLNPHTIQNYESLCSAELCYLVAKEISADNKNLSNLAILGMVGDVMERNINKFRNEIINDAEVKIKKGFLLYPSTRPLDKALEYSSRPYIFGVTGDSAGTFELLKEAGIEKISKHYPALVDLSDDEMRNLSTAIMLRMSSKTASEHIGNLYLIKFFNRLEDARELSAILNACSRMGHSDIGLMVCLGNNEARKRAERIYFKYRQHIISGLKYISENGRIEGKEYVIINARDQVKDTLIGTLASILSFSSLYKEGTIIVAMAYDEDKIKVSARLAGRGSHNNRNLKELIESVACSLGGEFGGHKQAAGCVIKKEHEERFIDLIKRKLDLEMIKV